MLQVHFFEKDRKEEQQLSGTFYIGATLHLHLKHKGIMKDSSTEMNQR